MSDEPISLEDIAAAAGILQRAKAEMRGAAERLAAFMRPGIEEHFRREAERDLRRYRANDTIRKLKREVGAR